MEKTRASYLLLLLLLPLASAKQCKEVLDGRDGRQTSGAPSDGAFDYKSCSACTEKKGCSYCFGGRPGGYYQGSYYRFIHCTSHATERSRFIRSDLPSKCPKSNGWKISSSVDACAAYRKDLNEKQEAANTAAELKKEAARVAKLEANLEAARKERRSLLAKWKAARVHPGRLPSQWSQWPKKGFQEAVRNCEYDKTRVSQHFGPKTSAW